MKTGYTSYLLLVLWVVLMASSFVVSAHMVPYANAIASTGLRFILASLLMIPFIINNYQPVKDKTVFLKYGFISLFLVLFFIGLFEALKTTTAMRTSVIYTLVPLMSIVYAYLGLKLATSIKKLLGFILGSIGAIWVLLTSNNENLNLFTWHVGDGIFLLACMSLALHVVLVKKWGAEVSAEQGAFYIMLMGSILILPFMLALGNLDQVAWHAASFWQTLLYLTVFTTMATFFLQLHLVQKVGPNYLLAFSYLIPIIVIFFQGWPAILKLHESVGGILITLLALYLISKEHNQYNEHTR